MTHSQPIQSDTPPSLIGGICAILIAALAAGLFYGALGPFVPLIIVKALILVFAVAMVGVVAARFRRGFVANLVLGVLGGVAGVAGLWFGWLWQEFGLSDAIVLFRSGPVFLYQYLIDLSADYVYSFGRRGTSTDGGAFMTFVIWGGETALFALTPLISLFFGETVSKWADDET